VPGFSDRADMPPTEPYVVIASLRAVLIDPPPPPPLAASRASRASAACLLACARVAVMGYLPR